jgi:hypothetical protein
MKSQLVIGSIVLAALVLATAWGQSGRTEVTETGRPGRQAPRRTLDMQMVSDMIADLQARVERIEARMALQGDQAIAGADAGGGLSGAELEVDPKDKVMQLDRFETVPPDPADYARLKELQDEVDALERTVDQVRNRVASVAGRSGGYRGSGYDSGVDRERGAQGQLLADYQEKLRTKQGEVKRLEREIDRPKQVIHGHWGNRLIILRTTADLTGVLSRLDVGSYLTWTGRRHQFDDTSEEWVVMQVEKYELPEGGGE